MTIRCSSKQGVGEFCGASVMDMKNSNIVASLVLLVMMLTGGFYVQVVKQLSAMFLFFLRLLGATKSVFILPANKKPWAFFRV